MKKLIAVFILFQLLSICQVNAQDWKYTDMMNGRNVAYTLVETYDKGFIVPVMTDHSNSVNDITLNKLDINGQLLWKIEIGDGESTLDVICIKELQGGGYLIGGTTNKLDKQNYDPFIMRLNACLEVEWFRIFKEMEQDNRLDEIIAYKGQYLLAFPYLESNYITLALMDQNGNVGKSLTLDSINSESIRISDKGQIRLISDVGFLGKFADPFRGTNCSVVYEIDSNLNVTNTNYYFENDTLFPNMGIDLCYIGENREDYLALITDRSPKHQSTVMISRNLDESSWSKNINDTNFISSGINIVRIDTSRYAVSSLYIPDDNEPLNYIGLNYIIDSNANVISKSFENLDYKVSLTNEMIKTSEGKIMTVGVFSNDRTNYSVFCYQYNQDLSFAQKSGVVKRYDSLCSKAVGSQKIALPEPEVYLMDKDRFVSVEYVPGIIRNHIVYPNPSADKKYQFRHTMYEEIKVFNSAGGLEKTIPAGDAGVNEIDLSELQSGVYFVMVKGMAPIKVLVD